MSKRNTRTNRSRKRTTRTDRLRKNNTSRRRTRKGKTSRRRTRKGKTSRRRRTRTRTRKGKTSRRRTRKGNTSRRINKNKAYSGGGDLSNNITRYEKSKKKCALNPHMSWVKEGPFCMVKPASTYINQAGISRDIINKYILNGFVFETELGELDDSELARNFYRTIQGKTFYIFELRNPVQDGSHYTTTKPISGTNATETEANELIKELGQKLDLTGGDTDKKEKIARKIMRCVDTTGSPMLWAFPQSAFPEHGATPAVGQTKFVCIVGEGYVVQFVYYYVPIGSNVAAMIANGKNPLKGDRPDKKYADFVVRGFTKNLYLDGNDARSATMQVFPTDITDIDNIEKADDGFRQSLITSFEGSDEKVRLMAERANDSFNKQIIEDMVVFIKVKENGDDFHKWARESEWSKDTGGERDENNTPLRVIEDPNWIEKWSKATEIVNGQATSPEVTPPGSPERSNESESVEGIELVAGVEDDV